MTLAACMVLMSLAAVGGIVAAATGGAPGLATYASAFLGGVSAAVGAIALLRREAHREIAAHELRCERYRARNGAPEELAP